MQRPGWWPMCQLCCSLPDCLPQQRSENAGREQEGHMSGRQVQCHLLLKVRMDRLDGADSSRMTVPGIASLQKPSLERYNRSCSSEPKTDQLFSPHTTSQGQKVSQEKPNCISTSHPCLGIVSQRGSQVDAESSLACSQLCLSQQVFKKANKKASLTPNKQTLKSQVGKKKQARRK